MQINWSNGWIVTFQTGHWFWKPGSKIKKFSFSKHQERKLLIFSLKMFSNQWLVYFTCQAVFLNQSFTIFQLSSFTLLIPPIQLPADKEYNCQKQNNTKSSQNHDNTSFYLWYEQNILWNSQKTPYPHYTYFLYFIQVFFKKTVKFDVFDKSSVYLPKNIIKNQALLQLIYVFCPVPLEYFQQLYRISYIFFKFATVYYRIFQQIS